MNPGQGKRVTERPLKDTLTIERVARRLGMDAREVYVLIQTGKLIAQQCGWKCRVARRDLEEFLLQSPSKIILPHPPQ
jgi:excisionase family DNA binding protein